MGVSCEKRGGGPTGMARLISGSADSNPTRLPKDKQAHSKAPSNALSGGCHAGAQLTPPVKRVKGKPQRPGSCDPWAPRAGTSSAPVSVHKGARFPSVGSVKWHHGKCSCVSAAPRRTSRPPAHAPAHVPRQRRAAVTSPWAGATSSAKTTKARGTCNVHAPLANCTQRQSPRRPRWPARETCAPATVIDASQRGGSSP